MDSHRFSRRVIARTHSSVFGAFVVLLYGCAAHSVSTTTPPTATTELIARHDSALTSYAALWRVKMQRNGKFDDFRVEVFSRDRDEVSLYVRGFLGQSALKAVIVGDSLTAYFVKGKRYYSGRRDDLDTLSLRDTEPIVDFIMALMRGSLMPPGDSRWSARFKDNGRNLNWQLHDLNHGLEIRLRGRLDAREFPHHRATELEMTSADKEFRARIEILSASFNREIPAEKFLIEIPKSAVPLSREELVEMLTGLAP